MRDDALLLPEATLPDDEDEDEDDDEEDEDDDAEPSAPLVVHPVTDQDSTHAPQQTTAGTRMQPPHRQTVQP